MGIRRRFLLALIAICLITCSVEAARSGGSRSSGSRSRGRSYSYSRSSYSPSSRRSYSSYRSSYRSSYHPSYSSNTYIGIGGGYVTPVIIPVGGYYYGPYDYYYHGGHITYVSTAVCPSGCVVNGVCGSAEVCATSSILGMILLIVFGVIFIGVCICFCICFCAAAKNANNYDHDSFERVSERSSHHSSHYSSHHSSPKNRREAEEPMRPGIVYQDILQSQM